MSQDSTEKIIINSEFELENITREFLNKISSSSNCLCSLVGDLGAGKTTFVKYLLKAMGYKKNITSPTFSKINEYSFEYKSKLVNIFHMDFYRQTPAIEELEEIILNTNNNFIFIEWLENMKDFSPKIDWEIKIFFPDSYSELENNNINNNKFNKRLIEINKI